MFLQLADVCWETYCPVYSVRVIILFDIVRRRMLANLLLLADPVRTRVRTITQSDDLDNRGNVLWLIIKAFFHRKWP